MRLRHLPDAREAGASLGDLPHAGYYPHPLGLFTLYYPADWALLREIRGGNVVYAVTPENGKTRLDDTTVTFQVTLLSLKKDALLASRSPAQILQQLLPSLLKDEPGLHATGSMTEAPLDNIPAVLAVPARVAAPAAGSISCRGVCRSEENTCS